MSLCQPCQLLLLRIKKGRSYLHKESTVHVYVQYTEAFSAFTVNSQQRIEINSLDKNTIESKRGGVFVCFEDVAGDHSQMDLFAGFVLFALRLLSVAGDPLSWVSIKTCGSECSDWDQFTAV